MMIDAVERLLDDHAGGRVSRREAVRRLLELTVAGVAGTAALGTARAAAAERSPAVVPAGESTFRATGLNHLGLRVTDVARSRDFYGRHLGLAVIRDNSPGNCFLRAGDHYLGLFRSPRPALDHFCLTVADYDAGAAQERLAAAGLPPRREEDRVYFDDPDGLEVQLDSRFGSWPGPRPADSG